MSNACAPVSLLFEFSRQWQPPSNCTQRFTDPPRTPMRSRATAKASGFTEAIITGETNYIRFERFCLDLCERT
jgi:hypothetical protein